MEELESELETVLVFNDNKTKLMIFSTAHLSQKHNLKNNKLFKVMDNAEAVERVNTKKILGIHLKTYPGHIT